MKAFWYIFHFCIYFWDLSSSLGFPKIRSWILYICFGFCAFLLYFFFFHGSSQGSLCHRLQKPNLNRHEQHSVTYLSDAWLVCRCEVGRKGRWRSLGGGGGMECSLPTLPPLFFSPLEDLHILFFQGADTSPCWRPRGSSVLTPYSTRGTQWPCSPAVTRKVQGRPHRPNIQNQVTTGKYFPQKKHLGCQWWELSAHHFKSELLNLNSLRKSLSSSVFSRMFRQLFGYMGVSPLLPLPCFTMNYLKMYRLLCIQHQGIKFSLILDVIHSPTLTVASWQITCPRHSQLQILVVLLFNHFTPINYTGSASAVPSSIIIWEDSESHKALSHDA